jgi:hypothetical protein
VYSWCAFGILLLYSWCTLPVLTPHVHPYPRAHMKMLKVDIPLENSGNITNIASETIDLSAAHLIFSYLAHHCYSETATAFLAQWLGSVKESSAALSAPEILAAQTLQFRSHLRALLVDGRISEAIQYMEEFFPHLLGADDAMNDGNGSGNGNGGSEDGSLLRFKLLCQQFVEMVRHGDSTLALEFIETTLTPLASNRPVLMKLLEEVIVLLAYSDPQDSPVQHLLAFRYREQLAETVNSAIIRQKNSSLELILKQLVLINLTGSDNTGQSESQEEGIDLSLFLKDILAS